MSIKLTEECDIIDEELRKVIVQKQERGTRMPQFGGGRGCGALGGRGGSLSVTLSHLRRKAQAADTGG